MESEREENTLEAEQEGDLGLLEIHRSVWPSGCKRDPKRQSVTNGDDGNLNLHIASPRSPRSSTNSIGVSTHDWASTKHNGNSRPTSASSSCINLTKPQSEAQFTELSYEVQALSQSLGILQKSLVSSHCTQEKIRIESNKLQESFQRESSLQTAAFQEALKKLKEICDKQLVEANKVFAIKIASMKSRYIEATKQTENVMASAETANKSALNIRIARDEANLELTKVKIEALTLKKQLDKFKVKKETHLEEQRELSSLEDELISLDSTKNSYVPPLPGSSRPSMRRPNSSYEYSSHSRGLDQQTRPPLWRQRIKKEGYIGHTENNDDFDFDLLSLDYFTTDSMQSKDVKIRAKFGPYHVNNLHEVLASPSHEPDKMAVPQEVNSALASAQKKVGRSVYCSGKRSAPTTKFKMMASNTQTEAQTQRKDIRVPRTSGKTRNLKGNAVSMKSKRDNEAPLGGSSFTKVSNADYSQEMEARLMKYEDDLAKISDVNSDLLCSLKASNTLLNVMYKENELLSQEINILNEKIVSIEFDGAATAVWNGISRLADASGMEGARGEGLLKIMNDMLSGYDETVNKLLDSHRCLTDAIISSIDVLRSSRSSTGNNLFSGINDRDVDQTGVLSRLSSTIKDLESILMKSKSDSYRNQLQLLTATREKEECQLRLEAAEKQLKTHHSKRDVECAGCVDELEKRRQNHQQMVEDFQEASKIFQNLLTVKSDVMEYEKDVDDVEEVYTPSTGYEEKIYRLTPKPIAAHSLTAPFKIHLNNSLDQSMVRTCTNRRVLPAAAAAASESESSGFVLHAPCPKRIEENSHCTTTPGPGVLSAASVMSEETRDEQKYVEPIFGEELMLIIQRYALPVNLQTECGYVANIASFVYFRVIDENLDVDDENLHQEVTMLKLPPGWMKHYNEDGALFYWDEIYQQSSWLNPNLMKLFAEVDRIRLNGK